MVCSQENPELHPPMTSPSPWQPLSTNKSDTMEYSKIFTACRLRRPRTISAGVHLVLVLGNAAMATREL